MGQREQCSPRHFHKTHLWPREEWCSPRKAVTGSHTSEHSAFCFSKTRSRNMCTLVRRFRHREMANRVAREAPRARHEPRVSSSIDKNWSDSQLNLSALSCAVVTCWVTVKRIGGARRQFCDAGGLQQALASSHLASLDTHYVDPWCKLW